VGAGFFRSSGGNKKRTPGGGTISQRYHGRWFCDVSVFDLRAALRQRGKCRGAYQTGKKTLTRVGTCRHIMHYR